jgi:hypothetical protein
MKPGGVRSLKNAIAAIGLASVRTLRESCVKDLVLEGSGEFGAEQIALGDIQ